LPKHNNWAGLELEYESMCKYISTKNVSEPQPAGARLMLWDKKMPTVVRLSVLEKWIMRITEEVYSG
jgi:hypothetical protein